MNSLVIAAITASSRKMVLLDFYAEWCQPCQRFFKILPKLQEAVQAHCDIIKINTDELSSDFMRSYEIEAIPTFMLLKNGTIVERWSGIKTMSEVSEIIEGHVFGIPSQPPSKEQLTITAPPQRMEHTTKIYIGSDGRMPERAKPGDLGYDIFASEQYTIRPHLTVAIPTGVYMAFHEGYGARLCDRSSMALKGLFVHGGIIDNGYTGEIKVILYNSTDKTVIIHQYDKIAQLLPTPVYGLPIDLVTKEEFDLVQTDRGAQGFGSTGR